MDFCRQFDTNAAAALARVEKNSAKDEVISKLPADAQAMQRRGVRAGVLAALRGAVPRRMDLLAELGVPPRELPVRPALPMP